MPGADRPGRVRCVSQTGKKRSHAPTRVPPSNRRPMPIAPVENHFYTRAQVRSHAGCVSHRRFRQTTIRSKARCLGGFFLRKAIDEITHPQSLNLYEHSSFRNEIVYRIAVFL